MFEKLKNLVSAHADKIIRDPVHASRVILVSVLTLGILSLTLNLSSQIMPEFFSAQQLGVPTDTTKLEELQAVKAAADKVILAQVAKCQEHREAKNDGKGEDGQDYKKIMARFQKSMSGILPGAGNLILNDPAAVEDRKEQLIVEFMKKYTNFKFCIPEETFEPIYRDGYSSLRQHLNAFLQIRSREDDTTKPDDKVHKIIVTSAMSELSVAERDILETWKYVSDTIDRAIESAIELDKQTGDEVARLTTVTANRLASTTNMAIKILSEVGKEGNMIDASVSGMTADIRSILAVDHSLSKPVGNGGSWEKPPLSTKVIEMIGKAGGHDAVYSSDTSLDQSGLPAISGGEIQIEISDLIRDDISYGLLNLFALKERTATAEYLGKSATIYAGARLGLDPFTPGSEEYIKTLVQSFAAKLIDLTEEEEKQICYSLDPVDEDQLKQLTVKNATDRKKCFGFEAEPPI